VTRRFSREDTRRKGDLSGWLATVRPLVFTEYGEMGHRRRRRGPPRCGHAPRQGTGPYFRVCHAGERGHQGPCVFQFWRRVPGEAALTVGGPRSAAIYLQFRIAGQGRRPQRRHHGYDEAILHNPEGHEGKTSRTHASRTRLS